jgi:O-antigen/teichoic acid export membrane protein
MNLNSNSSKFIIILASRVIIALVGIVFVPIYINYVGAESYGLISFYATLSASLLLLDFGLSTAVSRQLSFLRNKPNSEKDSLDLVRTVEIIYWTIAVLTGLIIMLSSELIATHWVKSKDIPITIVRNAVLLMGIMFAFQWPASIYSGSLTALEKQAQNAVINVIFSLLKSIGVLVVLKFGSPTVTNYFIWQTIITLVNTIWLRQMVWRSLPQSIQRPIFTKQQLISIWKFTAGITGITLISFFFTQFDKVIISKLLLLEFVGYYNLGFMLASILVQIAGVFYTIIFPKFSALYAQKNNEGLVKLYFKYSRLVSIIVLPVAIILVLFAHDILWLWTHNLTLTTAVTPILQIATIGNIFNVIFMVSYYLMLAKGQTVYTIWQNLISVSITVPLLLYVAPHYGAIGTASVWFLLNAGLFFISLPIIHIKYVNKHLVKWYIDCFFTILIVAVSIFSSIKLLINFYEYSISIPSLCVLISLGLLIYAMFIKEIREKGCTLFRFLIHSQKRLLGR